VEFKLRHRALYISDGGRSVYGSVRGVTISGQTCIHGVVVSRKRGIDDGVHDVRLVRGGVYEMMLQFWPTGESSFMGDDELSLT